MKSPIVGSGVGVGIAVGRAYVVNPTEFDVHGAHVPKSQIKKEIRVLDQAIADAAASLSKTRAEIPPDTPKDIAAFLDAHILMIRDESLRDTTVQILKDRCCTAESALLEHRRELLEVFDKMQNPYLRSKKDDVDQIIRQILMQIIKPESKNSPNLKTDMKDCILVAHELTPADAVAFKQYAISGFVTNLGSPISHVAILAHSLGVPAVIGIAENIDRIHHDDLIAINSTTGEVFVEPDADTLDALERVQQEIIERQKKLQSLRFLKSKSIDGIHIKLQANVELPSDIDDAENYDASGVGLYRTEYLFINRAYPPDENEQFESYRHIVRRLNDVTIRTLDLGADKQVDGGREAGRVSTNPALGLRAIRLCLNQPELFKPQLNAIYRASAYGDVKCMIPMLASVDEVDEVMEIIDEIKSDLKSRSIDFDPNLPVGAMIEVPSAAIKADFFADRFDFLSIGTNDLIQYTLAIDRIDDEVNYLYDPLNPSVLTLIQNTIDAGLEAGTPVSMCGEMAGNANYTRLLMGMGLKNFSINPGVLPEIKQVVRKSEVHKLKYIADEIVSCPSKKMRHKLLEELNSI